MIKYHINHQIMSKLVLAECLKQEFQICSFLCSYHHLDSPFLMLRSSGHPLIESWLFICRFDKRQLCLALTRTKGWQVTTSQFVIFNCLWCWSPDSRKVHPWQDVWFRNQRKEVRLGWCKVILNYMTIEKWRSALSFQKGSPWFTKTKSFLQPR